MSDFFTGCLHLNHQNIIKYCNRPFENTDDMNNTIFDNINEQVGIADRLYINGDFLFGPLDIGKFLRTARYCRNKINCRNIYLVYGNHDRRAKKYDEFIRLFNNVADYMEIKLQTGPSALGSENEENNNQDLSLILFHYPISAGNWNRANNGAIHLHSHVHTDELENLKNDWRKNKINISMDLVAKTLYKENEHKLSKEQRRKLYRPYSLSEILSVLKS